MRRAWLAFAFVCLTSCSAIVDLSDLGAADGSSDGATDADPGNVLTNGGFEQSGAACGPGWAVTNATMTRSPSSHSGGSSCEVCVATPGKVGWLIASPAPVQAPPIGATYYAQAWMKIEPDASLNDLELIVMEGISGGSATLGSQSADLANPDWQIVQASARVNDAGKSVSYNVLLFPTDGGRPCVLVDDTELIPQ